MDGGQCYRCKFVSGGIVRVVRLEYCHVSGREVSCCVRAAADMCSERWCCFGWSQQWESSSIDGMEL
jgi:hypothetical protein